MPTNAIQPPETIARSVLRLFALSAFAIAQPVYDLIGRHAQFLVAHRAGPFAIVGLVLLLSVGIPLLLVAIEWAAGRVSAPVRAAVHTVHVAVLLTLIAAGLLRNAPAPVVLTLVVAVASGVAGAWAYRRWQAARTFLVVVSPAALIFPAVFLFATPAWRLVAGSADAPERHVASSGERPPVVLVVFDELTTLALLDTKGSVDRERFPSFAALADDAWWFPNATGAAPSTEVALPAILTGKLPPEGPARLPIAGEYPQNLITWLGATRDLNVSEWVTRMCPEDLCQAATADPAGFTLRTFASDVAVLYLHLVTPRTIATRVLPPVSMAWRGFDAPDSAAGVTGRPAGDILGDLQASVNAGRAEQFRSFVSRIGVSPTSSFHFIHSALPHHPYQYTATGQLYSRGARVEGLTAAGEWSSHSELVTTGRRQYVQQVQSVDGLLGELVARLKAADLYDRALLIVMADHGASFQLGTPHRTLSEANYRAIAAVPMFVKLPSQTSGQVSARRVSGVDVVPTIAGVIGATVPWPTDGQSMFARDFQDWPPLPNENSRQRPLPSFTVTDMAQATDRARRLGAVRTGAAVEGTEALIGRRVAELTALPASEDLEVVSGSYAAFEDVDRESGILPALVTGAIEGDGGPDSFDIAVAVNGVIQATTRTAEWNGFPRYFSVLLDPDTLRSGANTLDIVRLDSGGGAFRVSSLSGGATDLTLVERPHIMSRGRRVEVVPQIEGWVDRVEPTSDGWHVHGWAAARPGFGNVRTIVAFVDGRPIATATPSVERPDVTAAMGLTPGTRTAFMIEIQATRQKGGKIRFFALSINPSDRASETAGELQVQPAAAAVLNKMK